MLPRLQRGLLMRETRVLVEAAVIRSDLIGKLTLIQSS